MPEFTTYLAVALGLRDLPPILLYARANLAVCPTMRKTDTRRACRHPVTWPARVRAVTEDVWHAGQVVNLSVTGVLLQLERKYNVGERVEVEIDFLTQPENKTVVAGIGYVVRGNGHGAATRRAAIHFDLGCAPKAVAPRPAAM